MLLRTMVIVVAVFHVVLLTYRVEVGAVLLESFCACAPSLAERHVILHSVHPIECVHACA
jgi:hypothetical protein